jgi:cell division septation protein DedD
MTSSPIALPVNILQNKDGYVVDGLEFVLQSLQSDTSAIPAKVGEQRTVPTEKPQIVEEKVVPPPPIIEEKVVPPPPSIINAEKQCIVIFDAKREGYILQISSWPTKSKANRVAKRVYKIIGLKTFIEAADVPSLGRRYRVFIGVFKTREEAVVFCRQFDFEL